MEKAKRRLNEKITVRFSDVDYIQLQAEAEKRGISVVELVRDIVKEFLIKESCKQGLPEVEITLRKIIDRHVERLAGLCVHAGIAAGTSAWLARSIIKKEYGQEVVPEIWAQAVARAKENLKRGTLE